MPLFRRAAFSDRGVSAKFLAIAFVAGYVLVAWSIYYLLCRFQFVQTQAVDYVVLAIVTLGVPLAFVARGAQTQGRRTVDLLRVSGKAFVGGALLTAVCGGVVIRVVNGLLDPHAAQPFATTIVNVSCKDGLSLKGAPDVPTSDNTMRIEAFALDNPCLHARIGDTVIVFVKAGLLGRAWIAGYAVHALPDVAQQALAHHRALLARLRTQAPPDTMGTR